MILPPKARFPRPERPGLPVALAAPSGALDPARLQAGLEAAAELAPGVQIRAGEEILARRGYLAGDDRDRAAHLAGLMADPGVGLVWAARGGFGCSRLLGLLDLEEMVRSGGLLLGFSDLTCLLNALAARGLITIHGPVVTQAPSLNRQSRSDLARLLSGGHPWPALLRGRPAAPGRAEGRLLGGNLTMLTSLLGTPYFPDLRDSILLLEDVGEAPYRLDRMVTHFLLSGVLEGVAGLALGGFSARGGYPPERSRVVVERLGPLGKPMVAGLPVSHGRANRPVPLGAPARLDGDAGTLEVGLGLA